MVIRAVVPAVLILAVICGIVSFAGTLWALTNNNWVVYSTIHNGIYGKNDRIRGLTKECSQTHEDKCIDLESYDSVKNPNELEQEIFSIRAKTVGLTTAAAVLTAICYVVGGILFVVFRKKDRARQLMLLIVGICIWCTAFIGYSYVISFLDLKNKENYYKVPRIKTVRGGWMKEVRDTTVEELGPAYKMAEACSLIGHIGGFLVMAISMWA